MRSHIIHAPRLSLTEVHIPVEGGTLEGLLTIPDPSEGLVIFVHGSGSSRNSPRNRFVAQRLQSAGLGTLLFDLLTPSEEAEDWVTLNRRFNIPLLAGRLVEATRWIVGQPGVAGRKVGFFGASTGAAAALMASTLPGCPVETIVSRGGRPDLAGAALRRVTIPTLLLVGGSDWEVLELNRNALSALRGKAELRVIPGATHLFEEPGTLEQVSRLAGAWFHRHLAQEPMTRRTHDNPVQVP
jgi:dienelactone hydrolase